MNLRPSYTGKFRNAERSRAGTGLKNRWFDPFRFLVPVAISLVLITGVKGLAQTTGVDDAVRYALANNKGLEADRQQLVAAQGRLRQAGLKANPMLEASGLTSVSDRGMQSTSVMLSLPLEANGRRMRRIAVAERELQRLKLEIADRERMLGGEVRRKYGEVLEALRIRDLYVQLMEVNQRNLKIIEARVSAGASAQLELSQLETEVIRIEVQKQVFDSRVAVALEQLKQAIGMSAESDFQLKDDFGELVSVPPRQALIDSALSTRPDLKAAAAAEAVADALLAQARTEGRFDLSIFTELGFQRLQFDQYGYSHDSGALERIGMRAAMMRGGITITLPTRNRNQGNVDAAVSMLEEARLRRQFIETVVRQQVAAGQARLTGAVAVLNTYNGRLLDTAENNLRIVQSSFSLGYVKMSEVLAEQRRLLEVKMNRVGALKEYFDARSELQVLTGLELKK